MANILHAREAIFRGSADFSKVYCPDDFDQERDFSGALFVGPTTFTDARFEGPVSFHKAEFKDVADFSGANFWADPHPDRNDSVDFMHTKFDGPVRFVGSKFENNTYFVNVVFKGDADFSDAVVLPGLSFNVHDATKRTRFEGLANFRNFRGTFQSVNFSKVDFLGNADFTGARFLSGASFEGAKFYAERVGLNVSNSEDTE